MPRDLLWLNGEIMDIEQGAVSVEDRGNTFSDGIYEVIVFYNGNPFMLREHLMRWEYSARGLMIDDPMPIQERERMLMGLVDQSGHRDAMVYGQMSRGVAKRNHLFPAPTVEPTEFWFVRPAPAHNPDHYHNGVKLFSHPDERWAHCEYKTISLLPNVLAKERANRVGAYEALLYTKDGFVTECSSSNAYCIRDGVLYTHPQTPAILAGITRIAILEEAKRLGVPVREEAVRIADFRTAQEVFISSTTMEVMPVTRIDDDAIGTGKVGPIARKLREAVRERVSRVCGCDESQQVAG